MAGGRSPRPVLSRPAGRRWEDSAERLTAALAELCAAGARLEEISERVLEAARELTGSALGYLGAIDTQTASLRRVAASPASWGAEDRPPLSLDPWLAAPRAWEGTEAAALAEPGAVAPQRALAVPARVEGATVGVLALADAPRPYGPRDAVALGRLATLWGGVLARQRLQASLEGLRAQDETLFHHHPDGVAVIAAGRFIYTNPAFGDLLGWPCEDLLGRSPTEFVGSAERAVVETRMATGQGGTRTHPSEYRLCRRDGGTVAAEAATRVISWSGAPAFLCVFRDISARKAAEEELRHRQFLQQTLADFDASIALLSSARIVQSALRFLRGVVAADRLSIALRQPDGLAARLSHVEGADSESLGPRDLIPLAETMLGRVMERGEVAYVPELGARASDPHLQALRRAGMRSVLIVPLAAGGASVGTLNVSSRSTQGIAEAQRELLSLLAPRLAAALQNSLLHEELGESERRYHRIFDSVPVSIWEEDFSQLKAALAQLRADGIDDLGAHLAANPRFGVEAAALIRVLDVNDYTLKLYRATSKEELLGSLTRVFTEESYPAFEAQLLALAAGRRIHECEGVNRTLRGERLSVMVKAEFPPLEGDFSRVTVSITDLTRRVEAEEALRERTRFETLLSSISTHFLNLEPGRIGDGVASALESLGRFAEADRSQLVMLSGDGGRIGRIQEWRRDGADSALSRWEGETIGELPWFAGELLGGRCVAVCRRAELPLAATRERKLLEAEDVRSCLLVPLVTRGVSVGALGLATVGRERTWPADSEAQLKIVGGIVVSALERERVQDDLRRAHDELERRVRERTADLERAKRELEEDIAARERTEEEKLVLERQLRQGRVFEAVGQLAGGVAHDFNNILGSVIGCLYAARLQAGGNPALLEELDRAQALCQRGGDLTRRLLTVARRQPGRPALVRLTELVAEVRTLLERTLPKDIALRVELPEDLPSVCADRSMLTAALLNLCLNARDAMPRGGTLWVKASRDEAPEGTGWVSVRVSDTGVGIPSALHDRVFDPFFTTKGPGEGTGLGLAMVEATAREYGGEVSLQSEPSEGSTFTLRFPAVAEPPAPRARECAELRHPLVSSPILVVEDEDNVARMVCQVLGGQGYATLRATTGLEALEQVRDHAGSLGLVILDLVLPELGGEEVYRLLRSIAPEVAVLLITGREDLAHTHLSQAPLLPKPFTPAELLEKVAEQLGPNAAPDGRARRGPPIDVERNRGRGKRVSRRAPG